MNNTRSHFPARFTLLFAAMVALGLFVIPVAPAHAATFNVPCDNAALRTAMDTVNSNNEPDTVNLTAGCTYTMPDQSGALPDYLNIAWDNGNQTTIEGNGATVTVTTNTAVVEVWGDANAVINNLNIVGGNNLQFGGGLFTDNGSVLVISNSTISGGYASVGGGVYSRGNSATLNNVTISSAHAQAQPGGNPLHSLGGGVYVNSGTVTINNSTISGNTAADDGGGIFVASGTLNLNNSTVSGNSATNEGGGIENFGATTINSSTFSGNSASNGGAVHNGGNLTIINSTLSGNTATAVGGGFFSDGPSYVYNSTIVSNGAPSAGNVRHESAPFDIKNSILANATSGGDCTGNATLSYSLSEGGGCGVAPGVNGNLTGDPNLGPLANNGGSTLTHALQGGSIAHNAGSNALIPGGVTLDQTGDARIQDTTVDMGSVEGGGAVLPISVSSITRSGSNPTNAGSVSWTVTFSGSAAGVTAANFALVPTGVSGASISTVTGSATTWTVTATTGSGDGTLGLDLSNATGITPPVSNAPFTGEVYTIDKTAPSAVISSTATSPTNTSPIPVTITFSESVTGVALGDLTVGNGTASNLAGGPSVYTVDITPTADGLVTVDVAAGVANDTAGNGNTAAVQFSITYDGTAPTAGISSTATSPTNTSPIPVTITFSESVTGFTLGDLTVGNGTASNLAGGPSVYTVDITPSADGLVTVDVAASVANDAAGNGNSAAVQFSITYDTTAPTVTISSTATSPTNTSPIPVTVTFSEPVLNFIASDVTVGNGTASNLAGGPSVYTVDITPTADGLVTVDVAAGVANDAAGNGNTAAAQFSISYDSVAPTTAISSTATSPTNTSPIPVTVTFSESVTGFVAGDVTVGNGAIDSFAGSGAVYTFNLVPSANGLVTVDVAAGVANDAAGNPNGAAVQFSITYDSDAPSAVISSSATSPTNTSPIPVTVTFSEPVLNFAAGDVVVGNGSLSGFAGSGAVYTFNVTPSAEGVVTVNVAAGVANDAAGNANTAAAQFSITYDVTAPTAAISSSATSPTSTSPIPVTVTFSEPVLNFVASDVTVGNGTASNLAGGPSVYTVDITPAGDGLVTVDVAASVANDAAGNGNTAAAQFSITYDGSAPTVAISSTATSPTNTSPIPVTVTFSESVTGFVDTDVTAGNGTVSNFAGSGAVYTFDLVPSGSGLVTADVAAGVANDTAGNGNTAAAQFSITYDASAPTVVISSTATDPTIVSPIPVTVTFSEPVTAFADTGVTVGNGTVSNFAGSGAVYTFDVTPAAGGTVTVDVAAGVAVDSAGNGNVAAVQFSIVYAVPGLLVSPASLNLVEGSSGSYQLSLNTLPTAAPVSVTLTFDSTELTVNGSASPVVINLSDTTAQTISVQSLANPAINSTRTISIAHAVSASTAPEYPVGMSATVSVTISETAVAAVATVPPPPEVPLCEDHNFEEGGVVRSSTSDAAGALINCRVLYQNGRPTQWLGFDLYNAGAIGNQAVLDLGVVQAVDIFSPSGATYFQNGAVFCLRGSGTLIWLAASQAPRVPQIIGSYAVPEFPGFTCATLFEPGTLVLVSDNPLD